MDATRTERAYSLGDRYCPTGNHFRARSAFRVRPAGSIVRDCLDCESARKRRAKTSTAGRLMVADNRDFPGVDIDRIHYLRGAVRVKRAA